jgi:hypothetical protein
MPTINGRALMLCYSTLPQNRNSIISAGHIYRRELRQPDDTIIFRSFRLQKSFLLFIYYYRRDSAISVIVL